MWAGPAAGRVGAAGAAGAALLDGAALAVADGAADATAGAEEATGGGGINDRADARGGSAGAMAGRSGSWRSETTPTPTPMSAAMPATTSTERPVVCFGIETRALVPGIVGFIGPALAWTT